ncbi:MAG: hypothetical protein ACRDTP_08875, partial [Mycobacteriales bacterium]
MTRLHRAVPPLVAALLAPLAAVVLAVSAASAATPTKATVTFSQATFTQAAKLDPAAVTVLAGGSVTFDNTRGTANLTISGALAGAAKSVVIKAKSTGSIAVPHSATSVTLAYSATEPANSLLPVPAARTTATGQVHVTGVPAAGTSGGPAAAAGGSGDSAQPAAGGSGGQPSAGAPYVGPGLPGGVIESLAPGATAYANGPAPLVAPYETGTAPAVPTDPNASSST